MVLTRSMATTTNNQGDELRTTALQRQVQTLAAAVERLTKQNHDLENSCARRMRRRTLRRKTKKEPAQKEGTKRGQKADMPQVGKNDRIPAVR